MSNEQPAELRDSPSKHQDGTHTYNTSCSPSKATRGKSKRRGACKGNRYAIRHGLQSGSLPKGCAYVKREMDVFRKHLEDALMERKGEISLYDAATIQSAMRWERHALLAQRWLRKDCQNMDHSERLAYSREVAKASAERDKALKELGLDKRETQRFLEVLYSEDEEGEEEGNATP